MKRLTLAEVAAGGLLDPRRRARQAQLRYVSDCLPGIRRRRAGRGFVYIDPQGKRVTNRDERARIAALAIPPAWTDVWICPLENGHLQATGRDDRGRKQYRYHDRWHEMSNVTKFQKLEKFGLALPRIRAAVERELASRKLTKEKVVATVVHLLDQTGLRVGNEEYVRSNDSYGIATLRDEHLEVDGHTSRIRFRGKGGKYFEVELRDRRLARILSECQEIPGQELFQYADEAGEFHPVQSDDVNQYLQRITRQPFTAKDFRTWNATSLIVERLIERGACTSKQEIRRALAEATRFTAEALGNTVTVCKKYYIHPSVVAMHTEGRLLKICTTVAVCSDRWLSTCEQILLHLLGARGKATGRRCRKKVA